MPLLHALAFVLLTLSSITTDDELSKEAKASNTNASTRNKDKRRVFLTIIISITKFRRKTFYSTTLLSFMRGTVFDKQDLSDRDFLGQVLIV